MNPADLLAVNTLRALALDAVANAKEGHPGAPLGMAPMLYALFAKVMRYNPKNPKWLGRDRFVLSAGHASMGLYAALHLSGFELTLEDIKQFRAWGSKTPGHPEYGHTPGVETTTGPLGQGFANAVGMALAQAHLAAKHNTPDAAVFDQFIYCICSDGDLQEGISHEAASLAGHLGLGKLVVLYDDNSIQLDGPTSWAFSENITQRFNAYGWQVLEVTDGDNDLDGIVAAIEAAKLETEKPSLIRVKTTIGYGLPKAGLADVHGKAPKPEEVEHAKKHYGWTDFTPFFVPEDGARPWREAGARGAALEEAHNQLLARHAQTHPEMAKALDAAAIPESVYAALPTWDAGGKAVRTRDASHACINALAPLVPQLLGGSADLSGSNMTVIKDEAAMSKGHLAGRNINFGVREHAMAAIANGMAVCNLRPYVATFFTFSDYMKNSIRLAALMHLPVIYVFTHDSVGVGTDGPTHQPVEHLAGLRAIPNLHVIRPADANETASAWKQALQRTDGPTALILTRQDVPVLPPKPAGANRGAYVVHNPATKPQVLLLATGSEVAPALEAGELLAQKGIAARVVSMPCWETFRGQDAQYKNAVLPPEVTARVGVEAASGLGWHEWVAANGSLVTINRYGASAPEKVIFEKLGFTGANIAKVAEETLQ